MALALWVGIGGFLGSIFRYGLARSLKHIPFMNVPVHTMSINLLGSFLIGVLLAIGQDRLGENGYHFLIPGLLGGFTTYSAFSGETFLLLKEQNYASAAIYVGITLLGGLALTSLGYSIAKQ